MKKAILLLACFAALLLPAEQLTTAAVEPFAPRGGKSPAETGAELAGTFSQLLKERNIFPAAGSHARIRVSGAFFAYDNKNFIVIKAVSAGSDAVLAAAVNGQLPHVELLPELADDLARQIREEGEAFLPPPPTALACAAGLAGKVKGEKRKVFLQLAGNKNGAAREAVASMLTALEFTLTATRADAEFQLIGGGALFKDELPGETVAVALTLLKNGKPAGAVRSLATFTGDNAVQEAFSAAALSAASELLLKSSSESAGSLRQ